MPKTKKETRARSRTRSSSRSRSQSRTRSGKKAATTTPTRRSQSPARSGSKKGKNPKVEATPPSRVSRRIASKEEVKKEVIEKVEKIVEVKLKASETNVTLDKKVEDEKKVRKTYKKEFGGILGVVLTMITLPLVVCYLILLCHKDKCHIGSLPKIPINWKYYLDLRSAGIVIGWYLVQTLLAVIPIGKVVQGQLLVNGTRLKYRCNGFIVFLLNITIFGVGVYLKVPFTYVYDKIFSVMISASILSLFLSVAFYIKSRHASPTALSPGGNTGNIIYDFFMGHELNPRIGPLDVKFCTFRIFLMSWLMVNLCFVLKASQDTDGVSLSLAAVTVFQAIYVADALYFEEILLTTMDILYDGFGFMFAFGSLVWGPFLFSLQGLYLVRQKISLPYYILAVITVLDIVGYVIFRGSNSQKYEFRRDPFKPNLAHLESIPTISGKRLLVSGWWKLCRKPNYLGDIILAISWSLTCGFGSIIPFFYPIYCITFLILRERRDDVICKKKHGISWDRYCNTVKYRIFPYIY